MRTHLILLLLLGLISGFKSHDATLFASAETIETTTRNLDADLGDSSLALSYSLSRRGLKGSGAKYNSLAAGDKFTVALLADGTLRLWGSAPEVPAELTGVTRIAAGSDFVLARLNDGTVRAFGENKEGQCDVPGWAWGVKDVAAGMAHSLVLFQDGRVRGWGRNVEGQTNVPASLGEARMIAAGKDHSIAMLMDGSVQAWGSNAYGQSTIPDGIANGTAGTEARSIAAGDSFSAAALGDGSVIVWGLWQGKQQVVRYYIGLTLGVPVNLIQVVAGDAHIVVRAQAPDGLFVFGDNTNGQTNVPKALVYPQSPGLISSLMSGPKHSAALLSDGSLLIWGCKAYDFGQCKRPDPCLENNGGCSTLATCTSELGMAKCTCLPRHIGDGRTCLLASTPQFTQVVARSTYSLVLMSDGTVKGFGKWITGVEVRVPITVRNAVKIAGGPRHALALMPGGLVRGLSGGGATPIPVGLADVVDISVGSGFSVALLKDSSVKVWGLLRAEQSPVNGLKNVAQVSAGHDHVLALMKDGSVKAFGFFLGDPSGKVTVPKNLTKAIQVAAGYDHSLVLQVDGTVVAFGGDEFGQRLVPFGLSNVVQIVAGEKRSAALLANGKVMAWGADDVAQSTAIDNSDANNVKHIAIGVSHALGLLGDGSVRVFCGKNDQGQCNLPDPCTENRGGCSKDAHCQPRYGVAACVCKLGYAGDGKTCVADPKAKLEQVVAGFGSTAVRFADGTVRAFGRYFTDVPLDLDDAAHLEAGPGYYVAVTRSGKLRAWGGRDGTANMYLPVGLTGVKTTSATTAILEDGRIIAWGQNSKDLTPPSWLVPSSVAQLSSSGIHTLALLKDGSVKGWGNAVLTGAEGIRGLTMVSASTTHNLALSDDGRVVAFGGYNFYGERNVPYDVVDVKQVEAGSGYSLVVSKDGTVRGWGLNATGQIGIPKGLKNVQRVSAGDRHAVALLEDGTIVAWGQNAEVPADLAPDYF